MGICLCMCILLYKIIGKVNIFLGKLGFLEIFMQWKQINIYVYICNRYIYVIDISVTDTHLHSK